MTNAEYDQVLARSRALVAEPLGFNIPVEATEAPQSPATIATGDPAEAGEW